MSDKTALLLDHQPDADESVTIFEGRRHRKNPKGVDRDPKTGQFISKGRKRRKRRRSRSRRRRPSRRRYRKNSGLFRGTYSNPGGALGALRSTLDRIRSRDFLQEAVVATGGGLGSEMAAGYISEYLLEQNPSGYLGYAVQAGAGIGLSALASMASGSDYAAQVLEGSMIFLIARLAKERLYPALGIGGPSVDELASAGYRANRRSREGRDPVQEGAKALKKAGEELMSAGAQAGGGTLPAGQFADFVTMPTGHSDYVEVPQGGMNDYVTLGQFQKPGSTAGAMAPGLGQPNDGIYGSHSYMGVSHA